ncbi:MAG: hydrogenase maturation protease [Methanomicrobiales archaeon]|nr:hydrogenase maturation protease [Methanomicrobiales archaeon]
MGRGRIVIIGCGNPLMGNDGAGLAVVRLLEGRYPDVDCIDGGTGGLGLIPLMEGYEGAVIVDAMVGSGGHIGDVFMFETPPSWDRPACALQDIGVGEVAVMARELGYIEEVIVVGIEVGEVRAFSREIDPAVEEGIRSAREHILKILQDWRRPPSERPPRSRPGGDPGP